MITEVDLMKKKNVTNDNMHQLIDKMQNISVVDSPPKLLSARILPLLSPSTSKSALKFNFNDSVET